MPCGRCLFGSTVLTTNEESFFLKNVHKANLNTDGALNLGVCTLHSAEMLSGGFNWIALGFIVDLILEWKPDLIKAITDEVYLSLIKASLAFIKASLSLIKASLSLIKASLSLITDSLSYQGHYS